MKTCEESSGTPYTRLASATPQMNAAPVLPIVFAHSHVARQRGVSRFSRHSNETTRTISRTSRSSSAM